MLSSLVMPYANFDDVHAFSSIYKNAVLNDEDLNMIEFIGEQLISGGLIEDEDEPAPHKTNNTAPTTTLQIQNGALYPQAAVAIVATQVLIITKVKQPITCTTIPLQEFYDGIFHPPSIA
jgi:hypothetical protein